MACNVSGACELLAECSTICSFLFCKASILLTKCSILNSLGRSVTWLGRLSESPGALCSWEEHMQQLVERQLSEVTIPRCESLLHTKRMFFFLFTLCSMFLSNMRPPSSSGRPAIQKIGMVCFSAFAIFLLRHTPDSSGHLTVSTLDAFVKWRAGEIKGILDRRLPGKEIKIVCLKEAESVDVKPAMVIRT